MRLNKICKDHSPLHSANKNKVSEILLLYLRYFYTEQKSRLYTQTENWHVWNADMTQNAENFMDR